MDMRLKIIIAAVVVLVVVPALGVLGGIITLPGHTVTAQVDSAHEVVDKTYDADNAIYNYEWFKETYGKIKATEKNIRQTEASMDSFEMYGEPTEWDYQTKKSYNDLLTTKNGQITYYNNLVEEYNAKANMSNRNVFQDKLPMHVDKILW